MPAKIITINGIEQKIFYFRGRKVMLDEGDSPRKGTALLEERQIGEKLAQLPG